MTDGVIQRRIAEIVAAAAMTEFLLCGRCHVCVWTEVDALGRVYWRHPTYPRVPPPPSFYHECDICHDADVRLDKPYVADRKLVICGDECRAQHAEDLRQRQVARAKRNGAQRRWRDKQKLHLERREFERDDDATDTDANQRRSA